MRGSDHSPLIDPSPRPGVGVCDASFRYCRLLIANVRSVHALAIHSLRGRLYYADSRDNAALIETATLAGEDVRTLVSSKIGHVAAMTVHEQQCSKCYSC